MAKVPTYEPGGVYHRVRDIHSIYHGQRQGGISTPRFAPLIFLFTGESADQFGYKDGPRDDGTFAYTGEGQLGDMDFVRGNLAFRDHILNGRDLLLFNKLVRPRYYRFIGYFACDGFEFAIGPDRTGALRRIIIFHLRPVSASEEPELERATAELKEQPLEEQTTVLTAIKGRGAAKVAGRPRGPIAERPGAPMQSKRQRGFVRGAPS